jgi:hypothetical protein
MKKSSKLALGITIFVLVCLIIGLTVFFVLKNKNSGSSGSSASASVKDSLTQLLARQRMEIHQVLPFFESTVAELNVLIKNNSSVKQFKENSLSLLEKQKIVQATHLKHQEEMLNLLNNTPYKQKINDLVQQQKMKVGTPENDIFTAVSSIQKMDNNASSSEVMRLALWVQHDAGSLTELYRTQEAELYSVGQYVLTQ